MRVTRVALASVVTAVAMKQPQLQTSTATTARVEGETSSASWGNDIERAAAGTQIRTTDHLLPSSGEGAHQYSCIMLRLLVIVTTHHATNKSWAIDCSPLACLRLLHPVFYRRTQQ